ncbi:MAG: tetratricopeptide repeat protein [Bacteroidetes bacterium]|nr:tetratricopeptide repeat protein [Bacteroidota bacterium]
MKKSGSGSRFKTIGWYYLLPAILAFALYANTIRNNYSIDDNIVILNPTVEKGIKAIPGIFTSHYQQAGQFSYGYRPLTKATYAVEQTLFGRNPHVSHFINVLLYALTGIVLIFVLKRLIPGYNPLFIFCAVLLFIAHPLHTEAVASLKNREEILCFLFCIFSLYFFFQYLKTKKVPNVLWGLLLLAVAVITKQNAVSFVIVIPLTLFFSGKAAFPEAVQKVAGAYHPAIHKVLVPEKISPGISDFLVAAGLLLVPCGILLPDERLFLYASFIIYISCFTERILPSEIVNRIKNGWLIAGLLIFPIAVITDKPAFLFSIPFFLVYKYREERNFKVYVDFLAAETTRFFTPVGRLLLVSTASLKRYRNFFYLLSALSVIGSALLFIPDFFLPEQKRELNVFENPLFSGADWISRIPLGLYSLLMYLKLLFFPHPLLFYYGYKHVPDVEISDPLVIFSILLHLALLFVAIYYFRKQRLLSYGILYYLCTIIFFSNIPAPVPGIVAERLLFMPSLGFCIVEAWLLFKLFKINPAGNYINPVSKRKLLLVLSIILLAYSIKTIARNRDWKDEFTLFSRDIPYLKNSYHANQLFASQLIMQITGQPANQYEAAIMKNKAHLALKHFRQAIAVDSTQVKTLVNTGTLYYQFFQRYDSAEYLINKALMIDSAFSLGWFNLAICQEWQNKFDKAIYYYARAHKTDSLNINILSNLANVYFKTGNWENAIETNQKIMRINPASDVPYINIGSYYLDKKDEATAASWLEKAVQKNPANVSLSRQLSDYFKSAGHADKAAYYSTLAAKSGFRQ